MTLSDPIIGDQRYIAEDRVQESHCLGPSLFIFASVASVHVKDHLQPANIVNILYIHMQSLKLSQDKELGCPSMGRGC
jgi:hypothetical protein